MSQEAFIFLFTGVLEVTRLVLSPLDGLWGSESDCFAYFPECDLPRSRQQGVKRLGDLLYDRPPVSVLLA